jgi:hypothetical protein
MGGDIVRSSRRSLSIAERCGWAVLVAAIGWFFAANGGCDRLLTALGNMPSDIVTQPILDSTVRELEDNREKHVEQVTGQLRTQIGALPGQFEKIMDASSPYRRDEPLLKKRLELVERFAEQAEPRFRQTEVLLNGIASDVKVLVKTMDRIEKKVDQ